MAKPTRFVAVADSHGDMIDEVTKDALLDFIEDYKPQIRLHLGDAFDFRNLRKGASDEEKAQTLENDWKMGEEFLREYYSGGTRNVFLYGNHDDRIFQLAGSSVGVLRDYANDGVKRLKQIFKDCDAKTLPYDSRLGVFKLGKLKAVHGYFCGKNSAARHGAVYGNVIYGHVHTIETSPVETLTGPEEARGIGCLATINMDYNSRSANKLRHNNGWCYGVINENGTYSIFQTARVGNDFLCATKFARY